MLWLFSDIVQDNIDDKHVKYYYYGSTEPDNPENLDPDSWIETTYYGPISITITNDVTNSQITFTNGASYTPVSPTAGTTNQPIGGFSLQADFPGASLTSVTISTTGTRSGITNLKLWSSTDATFNASSDTLLNSQSDNASVTFSGFSSTISTAGSYYFVTADLSTSASGSIALTIGSVSNLTFSGGAIASGFTNAPLSSGTITIILIREMNITGNGVTILNGDTSPAASDHTDFGSVDIASGSVVHTFTIQNNGAEALSLTGSSPFVAISGATADFSLTQNPSSSIAGNSSTTFEITFNPASTGLKSAVISIANDDGDENPYTFTIQGTGTAVPNMSVSGNAMQITNGDIEPSESDDTDFGSVNIAGDPIEHTFTIANNGSASLTLTGSSPYVSLTGDTEDFTLTQLPASNIAAGGGTTTFKITFKPTATGNRSATVSIANDDDSKNPFNFSIQGSGISVPTVTTAAASSVTKTVATLGGNVTSDGGSPITETGVVYSSSNATPTIGGMDVIQNANIDLSGDFSESISPLSSATHYYFQAYATNAAGTSYGGVLEFTTLTSVVSILRADPDDTNAASVRWNVVFENNVTGLSASNFTLVSFGISGAAITGVSGSGTNWIVTASTGSGTGSLRLGLVNDNGLTPKLSNPTLGGDAYTLDLVSPSVTDVDTGKPDGTYGVGSSIGIVIMFDESHNVDGTPQLTLKMDSMNRVIDCISNEHIRLICTYTVQAGDNTSDLDYAGMTALSTNGGTIRDYHGNDAILNLPWNAGTGSLAGNNAIVIDTTPPEITIHHPGSSAAVSKTITATTSDGTIKMSNTRGTTCDGSLIFTAYASQTFNAETDNGIRVCYQAVDTVNNISYKLSDPISGIDTTKPTTSIIAKPGNPDNSASPSFTFSGEDPDGTDGSDGSGIAGFECSLDGEPFSSCSSPKTYSSLGDGNHTFQVRSVDAAGNTDDSPESYTWQIDTSLPETTILSSPANPTASTDAVFEFEGADPGGSGVSGFECSLDGEPFSDCSSPKSYSSLSDGNHTFLVRSVDAVGNADSSPAEFNWTVDTTPPEIAIHHPGSSAAVSKTITATTSDGTIKMSNTRGTTCDGSLTFTVYASQTFNAETDNGIRVCYQAVDAVNNISYKLSDPISGIDTTKPTTSIIAKPGNPDNSASPSFTFSGEDPDGADGSDGSGIAGFECSLDGEPFSSCSSPKTYSSLGDGNHTFQVRSVDAAGNTDDSPESYTWQIDTSLPETTILSSPANLTTSTDAVFEFEGDDPGGSGIENLECMLDSSTFSVCTSPKEYNALPDGSHNFQVRAVDTAGNVDPSPAEINWTIDTTAPTVLISSTESDPTNVNPIPITVQFSEPVTGFEESDIMYHQRLPRSGQFHVFLQFDPEQRRDSYPRYSSSCRR
ncbi:choice-of-anchor D domain-containing protein [Flexilinea flocculi]|uniref:Protein containing bacterial Ig-like domain n=1 Tax=Flexilinea flocculi TaxID=1678840 RepID=A0A0K8PBD9_9CHLR|nr:choice-of-anchor D domain-containing protein [Flexilinea flocculi]GAP39977.1 protein containing bacterial Ig-like domain [Flexilinea flocculi]